MLELVHVIAIDAPPAKVWNVLANLEAAPRGRRCIG